LLLFPPRLYSCVVRFPPPSPEASGAFARRPFSSFDSVSSSFYFCPIGPSPPSSSSEVDCLVHHVSPRRNPSSSSSAFPRTPSSSFFPAALPPPLPLCAHTALGVFPKKGAVKARLPAFTVPLFPSRPPGSQPHHVKDFLSSSSARKSLPPNLLVALLLPPVSSPQLLFDAVGGVSERF